MLKAITGSFQRALDLVSRLQHWVVILTAVLATAVQLFGVRTLDAVLQDRTLLGTVVLIPLLAITLLYLMSRSSAVPTAVTMELPPFVRSNKDSKYLLLFLHGWQGDAMNTWQQFPSLVVQDARFSAFDVASIDYPTFMFRRSLDLSAMVSWLTEKMRRNHIFSRYDAIAVISHSLGGLVARELYVQSRLADDITKIVAIVSVGTPHRGADLARLAVALGIGSRLVRDARPGSTFLSALKVHWNAARTRPQTYGISSPQDDVVTEDSAHFLCDRMFSYPQWDHREMVKPESHADDRYATPTSMVLDAMRQAGHV